MAITNARTKTIPDAKNAALREIAHSVVRREGSQKRAAAKIGVSQPYLSDFLQSKRGAGQTLIDGLMRVSPDATRRAMFPRDYEPEARYAALERVLKKRKVPADVAAALWKRAAHTGAGETIDEATANAWVDEQIAASKGKAQIAPLEGDDDAPPRARRRKRK